MSQRTGRRIGRPRGLTPDGPEIKRRRVALGLTTAELAARTGCAPQTVRQTERGLRLSDVLASRIAKALGATIEDITDYGRASEPEPKVPAA